MKTAVIYYSKHHGNTKKLLEKIAEVNEISLINISDAAEVDLSQYDRIGFASGIYYSKFQKQLLKFAEQHMPENKETFFIYTYGAEKKRYTAAITEAVKKHNATVIGEYGCYGFNTFGPFKLIGGIAKGHPNADELDGVLKFYEKL